MHLTLKQTVSKEQKKKKITKKVAIFTQMHV